MKKRFRKMFAVVAATMLVLAMGMISVNAADIQPRGALCPSCGGTVRTTISYTSWAPTTTTRKCTHYSFGTDQKMQRYKYTDIYCLQCGLGDRLTATETRWECHGYY